MKTFFISMLGGALGVITGIVILFIGLVLVRSIHKTINSRDYVILKIEKYCKKHNKPVPNQLSERTLKALKAINEDIRK